MKIICTSWASRAASRSEALKVAVDFSPRNGNRNDLCRGATREDAKSHQSGVAPRRGFQPGLARGLKPTATVVSSLRDASSAVAIFLFVVVTHLSPAADAIRTYENRLTRIQNPYPLLADHREWVEPIRETNRFEAPSLVNDPGADLHARAWRYSYNARGIIEMPNHLRATNTAVIMVHPWGIDDGQGWDTPEPAGVADFCTPEKNHLAARHTRGIINPFLKSLRGKVALVLYSLPGDEDPIRHKLYRSFTHRPTEAERREGAAELKAKLRGFTYRGEALPGKLNLSEEKAVVDYFK